MRNRLWAAGIGVLVVAFVIAVVLLGALNPPGKSIIATDRLGPQDGESVSDYLAAARNSLAGNDTAEHWALVSLTAGIPATQLPEQAAGLRISQVTYHAAINRVDTPVLTVPVPAGDAAALGSQQVAAAELAFSQPADPRTAQVTKVVAGRLHGGCACAVALVVYGRLDQLRNLTTHANVRAVQALPADAAAGAFAITPLLPEQTTVVGPTPDDGPVPPN